MHFLEWVQIDPPYKSVLYKELGKTPHGGTTVLRMQTKNDFLSRQERNNPEETRADAFRELMECDGPG